MPSPQVRRSWSRGEPVVVEGACVDPEFVAARSAEEETGAGDRGAVGVEIGGVEGDGAGAGAEDFGWKSAAGVAREAAVAVVEEDFVGVGVAGAEDEVGAAVAGEIGDVGVAGVDHGDDAEAAIGDGDEGAGVVAEGAEAGAGLGDGGPGDDLHGDKIEVSVGIEVAPVVVAEGAEGVVGNGRGRRGEALADEPGEGSVAGKAEPAPEGECCAGGEVGGGGGAERVGADGGDVGLRGRSEGARRAGTGEVRLRRRGKKRMKGSRGFYG